MRRAYLLISVLFILITGVIGKAFACPSPGIYTVGPTGNYLSITQVISAFSGCTLTGSYIFELQNTYSSAVESFPLTIPGFTGASSTNTITFRPATGATSLLITSSVAGFPGGTIDLNGAKYVYFDGRAGGVGTSQNLTIENTNTGWSYAIEFINDACNNKITYCNVKGANTFTAGGTLLFFTTAGTTGNDDNTVDHCNIGDASVGTPLNGIYSEGSGNSASTWLYNSGNIISNNNIYNYYNSANGASGISVRGSTDWTITGNSFYQTASRNLSAQLNAINLVNLNIGDNFQITDNYVGGSAPNCGGAAMDITGFGNFVGIGINAGTTVTTNVKRNTIQNIIITSSGTSHRFIAPFQGSIACNDNIIGSQSVANSIQLSMAASGTIVSMIAAGAALPLSGVMEISNNKIGGITFAISGNPSPTTPILRGIVLSGTPDSYTLNENIINNISSSVNSALRCIFSNATSTVNNINKNTISNITQTSVGGAGAINCIYTQSTSSSFSITNNIFYNITSMSTFTGHVVLAINLTSTGTTNIIDNNSIAALRAVNASAAAVGVGAIFTTSPLAGGSMRKNRIYDITNTNTNAGTYINGCIIQGGNWTLANNMMSLLNSTNTNPSSLIGIVDASTGVGARNYIFNSIYIGGTGPNDAATTFSAAIQYNCGSGTGVIKNNIFVMARSKGAGSGNYYAIVNKMAGISGLTSDNNILNCSYPSSVGLCGTTLVTNDKTFANWKTAVSGDPNSYTAEPVPFTNTASGDLHIDLANTTLIAAGYLSNIESKGTALTTTVDYDDDTRPGPPGSLRGGGIAPDLGADEVDLAYFDDKPPIITYTTISTPTCAVNQSRMATIVDGTGVPVSGSFVPRIYYRKNLGTWFSQPGILTSGTAKNGTWNFTIIASDMLPLVNGDIVRYYITAQDIVSSPSFYITASPATGFTATNVNTVLTAASAPNSYTINSSASGTWIGLDADWTNAANWCGTVPVSTTDVVIPAGISIYPVLNSSGAVHNFSMSPGASLNITDIGSLSVSGTFSNSGVFTNNGELLFNGNTLQNFPGAAGTIAAMNNLTVNNPAGITFDRSFTLKGTLSPLAGAINLNNAIITLHSGADTTARVGPVSGGFSYAGTGAFEIERYIRARRAWRLLTAPVNNSTAPTINASWQEAITPGAGIQNPNPGYGTHITGGSTLNGFDQSPTNNTSIKYFTGMDWTGVPVTTNNAVTGKITNQPGYMLFVRGDRGITVAGTNVVPTNTILRVKGKLNVGTQLVNCSGYTVIGNPYASTINFHSIALANPSMNDKFYLWDPTISGKKNVGGWVAFTWNGVKYSPNVVNNLSSNGDIQSGSAFVVYHMGTIFINETNKTSGSNDFQYRPGQHLGVTLLTVDSDTTSSVNDGALTIFGKKYSDRIDEDDVIKNTNFAENFSLLKEGKSLAIEKRQPVNKYDTIFLSIGQMSLRKYRFLFDLDKVETPPGTAIFLEDSYLGTKTALNSIDTTLVDFSILSAPLSYVPGRFRILFAPSVTYTFLEAMPDERKNILVKWNVAGEFNLKQYEVERSLDGIVFTKLFTTSAGADSNIAASYKYLDIETAEGHEYYYRVKSISKNNVIAYSDVAKVKLMKTSPGMYIFPNPVTNNIIGLQINDQLQGTYSVRLLNSGGQVITSKKIWHGTRATNENILPEKILSAGMYQLEITLPDRSRTSLHIAIQ